MPECVGVGSVIAVSGRDVIPAGVSLGLRVIAAEDDGENKGSPDDNKGEVNGADEDIDDDNKDGDMLEVRPELAGGIISPADDDEKEIFEPWLELCEGHWVVSVSSLVMVGEVIL
ncbi:hypothetical protein NQZ68_017722 [Dissostichus eleginoides]|nr:hypothetical protein NQZ68_017722 [Dissostichus eleginoides]